MLRDHPLITPIFRGLTEKLDPRIPLMVLSLYEAAPFLHPLNPVATAARSSRRRDLGDGGRLRHRVDLIR